MRQGHSAAHKSLNERTKPMPVYDYRCQNCKKKFTLAMTVSAHDKSKIACPKCGSKKAEQQFSVFYTVTSKKS
jgi:putative FmdB family regulatory protein